MILYLEHDSIIISYDVMNHLNSQSQYELGNLSKTFKQIFSVKRFPPPPPTPLTENHFAKKPLAERGGTPGPPLSGKSPKKNP